MTPWDRTSLEYALDSAGWLVGTREIQHALQFELIEGVKVNLYDSGRFTFGGPKSDFKAEVEEFVTVGQNGAATGSKRTPSQARDRQTDEKRVFIVYGHDTVARNGLELILRRVQVNPIILENIPGVGDTLIEKLESLTEADFACVLLTPDDVGASRSAADNLRPRARQNVVLELGMVLSRLGRHRVAILVKGDDLEKPSDIDGLVYIPYENEVGEAATALGAALGSAGFDIDIRDLLGS